jgi:hypothetical protein
LRPTGAVHDPVRVLRHGAAMAPRHLIDSSLGEQIWSAVTDWPSVAFLCDTWRDVSDPQHPSGLVDSATREK